MRQGHCGLCWGRRLSPASATGEAGEGSNQSQSTQVSPEVAGQQPSCRALYLYDKKASNVMCVCVCARACVCARVCACARVCVRVRTHVRAHCHVQLLATPWTVAHQAPPSTGFLRQEYWTGPLLPPGDLLNPGIEPVSLWSALAGGFLTTSATWEAPEILLQEHQNSVKCYV